MTNPLEDVTDAELTAECQARQIWPDDVGIDDFSDDEIEREWEARGLQPHIGNREILLLAEMIAAKEDKRALSLLSEIHPDVFQPATLRSLVINRQSQSERLF